MTDVPQGWLQVGRLLWQLYRVYGNTKCETFNKQPFKSLQQLKYLNTDNFLHSAIIILALRILCAAPAGRERHGGPTGPPEPSLWIPHVVSS